MHVFRGSRKRAICQPLHLELNEMGNAGVDYSISGGGFFYTSFSRMATFTGLQVVCPTGVYGAWSHGAPGFILPHNARYIQISIENLVPGGGFYLMQFGLGAPGLETVWQPSDGGGFRMDWQAPLNWQTPYSFIFPSSIRAGSEISARGQVFVGGPFTAIVSFYIFN